MYKCESCQTGFDLLEQDEKDYLFYPHYDETIQTTELLEGKTIDIDKSEGVCKF